MFHHDARFIVVQRNVGPEQGNVYAFASFRFDWYESGDGGDEAVVYWYEI